MIGNGIEMIQPNAFKGMDNLRELDLAFNKIACLPPALFQNTPLIIVIRLEGNQITMIDPKIIRNLKSLMGFNLDQNKISVVPLLDMKRVSANSQHFTISFKENPLKAIAPTLVNTIVNYFNGIQGFLEFYIDFGTNFSNCVTGAGNYYLKNYKDAEKDLTACYSNWKSRMQSKEVPCDPTASSSSSESCSKS